MSAQTKNIFEKKRFWLLIILIALFSWFLILSNPDLDLMSADKCVPLRGPGKCVKEIFHNNSAVHTSESDYIRFEIYESYLTTSTMRFQFLGTVKEVMPDILMYFKTKKYFTIISNTRAADIRGNRITARAFLISFSRENARSINWNDVLNDDLPLIADEYWQHPSLTIQ